ncbi:MAG: 16S rRNA (cytidine(1402)-2'-O)-methyltransferase [Lachnospiraceae bacterium]|nr:16S rRNA (cytidine(1402)-2'-O)-methyltransferase [Lachnospiraceae bacterium]
MTEDKQGVLYLCATPIGNLGDITERVLDTLRSVDIIAAEDTRNSIKLLNHFGIKTPMTSYHEYNRYDKAGELIDRLREGKDIALITDAGTPCISDPGEVFVSMCIEAGIRVTSLPGACACITALSMSGLKTGRFCFEAFLPSDKKKRKEILKELKDETRTIILYEAPHHLKNTLNELIEALGDRRIALCRELTKRFEEVMHLTLKEAADHYSVNEPRGEYVLCIEGRNRDELILREQLAWQDITLEEHMKIYEDQGMDRKESMKKVAADRGISKREVYDSLIGKK